MVDKNQRKSTIQMIGVWIRWMYPGFTVGLVTPYNGKAEYLAELFPIDS